MNDPGLPNSRQRSGRPATTDEELSAELRKWTGGTPAVSPVGQLLDRHWEAACAYARLCTAGPHPAGMLTTAAFTRLFGQTLRQSGPAAAWRPQLLVTVRRIAAEWAADHRLEMLHPDLRTAAGEGGRIAARLLPQTDRRLLSQAFQRLPETARALLWHTEVEAEPLAAPARLLGLDEEGARIELRRARERLREECLQVHRELAPDQDCLRYFRLLDVTYRRGGVAMDPDLARHLAGCTHCRHTAGQLGRFNADLGGALAEGVLGWGAQAYRESRLGTPEEAPAGEAGPAPAATPGGGGTFVPSPPAPPAGGEVFGSAPRGVPVGGEDFGGASSVLPGGGGDLGVASSVGPGGGGDLGVASSAGFGGGGVFGPVPPGATGGGEAFASASLAASAGGGGAPSPRAAGRPSRRPAAPRRGARAAAGSAEVPVPSASFAADAGPRTAGRRSAHRAARRAARRRNLTIAVATVSGLVVLPLVLWSALGSGDGGAPGTDARPSDTPSDTPSAGPSWAGAGRAGQTTLRGRLHNVASGLCVGLVGKKAVKGAEAELATCSSTPGQQWIYERDGLLRSAAAPGLCLDSHLGYSVQLAPCAQAGGPGAKNVRYDFTPRGLLVPRFDRDLALTPAATDGAGSLVLKTRADSEVQRWVIDTSQPGLQMAEVDWDAGGRPSSTPAAPGPSASGKPTAAPASSAPPTGPSGQPTPAGCSPYRCQGDGRYDHGHRYGHGDGSGYGYDSGSGYGYDGGSGYGYDGGYGGYGYGGR
ncbi:ricin-type beta-trefoil lectin domain protein [Streptomyces sp. NPDC014864]|uniref:ricin-type beta-trefoil lectin domain protein n=1 Tax=Streptomyces sp. NPDC014864 TaxID=3364924 RepID=UPI0036FD449E